MQRKVFKICKNVINPSHMKYEVSRM